MAMQPYMGGPGQGQGAIVAYQQPELTPEERERRQKEAEVLEEKLKFINEKVATRTFNVMGSNAGAGSGTFHDYRLARRREMARQKRIDEAWEEEQKSKEFEGKLAQYQAEDEERTAKRRAKRQKKKARKKVKGADGTAAGGSSAGNGDEQGSDSDAAPPGGDAGLD